MHLDIAMCYWKMLAIKIVILSVCWYVSSLLLNKCDDKGDTPNVLCWFLSESVT